MAWTEITRQHYRRDGLRYESDTTDAEWFMMEALLPPTSALGRPRATDMRTVVIAILSHDLLSSVLLYLFLEAVAETRQPRISGVLPSE
jgi:hypothetical protein